MQLNQSYKPLRKSFSKLILLSVLFLLAWASPSLLWGADAPAENYIRGDSLWETFKNGGLMMIPLLLCLLLSIAFFTERLFALRQGAVITDAFRNQYRELNSKTEIKTSDLSGVELPGQSEGEKLFNKFIKRSYANVREMDVSLQEQIDITNYHMKRNIKPLGIITELAPLLGLLGTVIGIILSFERVAVEGMGDPKLISKGIATALLTTGFGLLIAIPSSIGFHFLSGKATEVSLELYHLLHELGTKLTHEERS